MLPYAGPPNLVDLARALAMIAGVDGFEPTPAIRAIRGKIGDPEHLMFALADGLAMNVLDRMPEDGFLRTHLAMELRSTAPSTTATALTSLATGCYPGQHAITGWFTHLADLRRTAIILPFVDRFSGAALEMAGITAEDAFPKPSLMPRMTRKPIALLPMQLYNSTYSRYTRGDVPGFGYITLRQMADMAIYRAQTASARTYTFIYLPQVDRLAHDIGPTHERVIDLAAAIEEELARLADSIAGSGKLVVAADHGQVVVHPEKRLGLYDGDPLLALLQVPPSGEGRFPLFHVRPSEQEAFEAMFADRFGQHFILLKIQEADDLQLFGPDGLDPLARQRFGDYLAIPIADHALEYYASRQAWEKAPLGRHGGLSQDEMRVPLIVAG
jgi:hypothetical protein